jgi:hypothetical protein
MINLLKKQILINLFFFISLIIFPDFINTKINCSGNTSTIQVTGTASKLILETPITNFAGSLVITDQSTTSITQTLTTNNITFATTGQIVYGNALPIGSNGNISTSSIISLSGSKTLSGIATTPIKTAVLISGTDNSIIGTPIFTYPITLQDSTTTVSIGIDCKLTGSIVMNGGSVYLTKDLKLKDEIAITGSGTIYFNGYSLVYPSYISNGPISSNLNMVNANDIIINTRTSQTSNTNFIGTNNIKGTGVVLDFTGGGSFSLANDAIVYMNGFHIKGLGTTGGGNITFGNANSKLYLTDCILELAGPYTQTNGQIIFEGGFSKVISNTNSKFILSGATTKLIIDGQTLLYENSNQLPKYPFEAFSDSEIKTINNGSIKSSNNSLPNTITLYSDSSNGGTISTYNNIDLSYGQTITFFNENPNSAKDITFDGNFNTVKFPDLTQSIIVQPNITLTIKKVKLDNFDPARFLLMGSGGTLAKLVFAEYVTFEIRRDLSLSTGALPLTGITTITGNSNSTLDLGYRSITLTGDYSHLTIKGLKIRASSFNPLQCYSSTQTVVFQNSEIYMTTTGITLDTGYLQIKDYVKIRGTSESITESTIPFNFSSKGSLKINNSSTLELGYDCSLNYSPDTSQDSGIASVEKRHLIMDDKSSMLILKKSTLNIGPKGLALDRGKLVISDNVTCNTSFTSGCEFEIGSNVNFSILSGAIFNVNGSIKYIVST